MWLLKKLFKKRDEQTGDGDIVKPFLDHLEDLRWTLVKMIVVLTVAMGVAFAFRKTLTHVLGLPLQVAAPELQIIDPIGPISLSFTLAFYAGIVVAFPILFYFLAEFLLPALTKKEKKYVLPAVGVGFGLFLVGVLLSYFYVLPATLRWLHNDAKALGFDPKWTGNSYYGFITHLCIAVGMVCELPVVMVTLSGIGLISYAWLKGMRMYGYVIALVLAGIISPTPDLFMLVVFALPIMVLFEACIWLVWLLEKSRKKKEEIAEKRPEQAYVPPPADPYHDHHDEHQGYDEHGHYHDEHGHYHDEHGHYHDEHHAPEEPGTDKPAIIPDKPEPTPGKPDEPDKPHGAPDKPETPVEHPAPEEPGTDKPAISPEKPGPTPEKPDEPGKPHSGPDKPGTPVP